jgi:hypothetical protein
VAFYLFNDTVPDVFAISTSDPESSIVRVRRERRKNMMEEDEIRGRKGGGTEREGKGDE